jgi:hypothetical protein
MKHLLLFFTLCSLFLSSPAQTNDPEWVFEAMQEELTRNIEQLKLKDAPEPFFIAYFLSDMQYLSVKSVLGSVTSEVYYPEYKSHAVRLLVGDHSMTNETSFDGPLASRGRSGVDANRAQLRRELWLTTDKAYKSAISGYRTKQSAREGQSEDPLDDLYHAEPFEYINGTGKTLGYDPEDLKDLIRELSAIFLGYPDLFNSYVDMTAYHANIYSQTTEGTRLLVPMEVISLKAEASVKTEDGIIFTEAFQFFTRNGESMPSLPEMKEKLDQFAKQLYGIGKASSIEEYYYGPVLFEEQAAFSILNNNLISSPGLIAYRRNTSTGGAALTMAARASQSSNQPVSFDARLGRRIIDSKLSITNYSRLSSYNGQPLFGSYEVDADGVRPDDSIILVENGILKGFLSSRIPMAGTKGSTGSNRFGIDPNNPSAFIAPGSLHITSDEHMNRNELMAALRKSAQAEGMEYAYIVRKIGGSTPYLYRYDLETGEETLVHSAEISTVALNNLRRVMGVSATEQITNFLYRDRIPVSVIHPTSILLEDIEIYKSGNLNRETEEILANPLKRKK